MFKTFKFFNILTLTVFFICSAGVRHTFAQSTITCESTNNRYTYCRVDTDNKVRLVRELSRSDCNENSSWGYDRRGIWVDRGCRGEFEYGKGISGKGAAIGAGVAGGLILAAILASRKSDSEKYNDPKTVYNLGFDKGVSDSKASKTNDPSRYNGKYNSNYQTDFIRGYNEGYRNNSGNSGNTSRAYSDGYQRGIDDSIANRRSDYRRYDNLFNSNTESDFRNGYEDGYKNNRDTSSNRDDENSRVPNWMVGTFRAYSSRNRRNIDLTIYADGRIWKRDADGSNVGNGTFSSGYLFIAGTNYRVTKNGNGFYAQNLSDLSENLFYSRLY